MSLLIQYINGLLLLADTGRGSRHFRSKNVATHHIWGWGKEAWDKIMMRYMERVNGV